MTIRVLVVDDSGFFRRRLCELIASHPSLEVVGTAVNGQEAIAQAERLKPDVITMDYEMPVMDGITAVREITRKSTIPVLMFSSLTYEGARVTLDALEAGAVDYLPKNFDEISRNPEEIRKLLCERIIAISGSRPNRRPLPEPSPPSALAVPPSRATAPLGSRRSSVSLVIIGASTGGPMALQQVLTKLPASFSVPVLLVQHMPGSFTKAFAERLDRLCKVSVEEAADGQTLQAGKVLLAPGGMQTVLDGRRQGTVKVINGDERLNYRPSLDLTFGSAAREYGSRVLGIVLTGMGADGKEGARLLKQQGARIWAQDEKSCVIYGMPMAVAQAGLVDEQHDLTGIGLRLCEEFS